MSKALELIRTLIDGANEYEKETGNKNPTVYLSRNNLLVIEKSLQRLESIDNANPSEALECLEKLEQDIKDRVILAEDRQLKLCEVIKQALLKAQKEHKALDLLMQELGCKDFAELRKYARCGKHTLSNLKGSQYDNIMVYEFKPKQYLKWENLKFEHTPKMFDVKMNDNKYRLVVGYNVAGNNLVILRNDKQQYYFLEADKQFFNDLHLERVEE